MNYSNIDALFVCPDNSWKLSTKQLLLCDKGNTIPRTQIVDGE